MSRCLVPAAQSSAAARPDVPAGWPDVLDVQAAWPDVPATRPDAPAAGPDAPAAGPDVPAARPDLPAAGLAVQAAWVDVPAARPDVPAAGPDVLAVLPDVLAHYQGVGAGRLIVAATDPDLGETVAPVKLLGTGVVGAHLKEDLGAAAPGCLREQRREQGRPGAPAPPVASHRERQHVTLGAGREQAGVAGDYPAIVCHQVVPALRLLGKLSRKHCPRPGLLAEKLALKLEHGAHVGRRHRPQRRAHAGVTRFGGPGIRASGLRRYSGSAGSMGSPAAIRAAVRPASAAAEG